MAEVNVQGLGKAFGATRALTDVSFRLRGGEVLALLGENGAGKSTLIKILCGVHEADQGQICIDDQPTCFATPQQAIRAGVVQVPQELRVVPALSVAHNVMLGHLPVRRIAGFLPVLDVGRMRDRARVVLAELGIDLDPGAAAGSLGFAEKQLIVIARALAHQAKILILDEPTASLEKREVDRLFDVIRSSRAKGVAIIYISHRLDEIPQIADQCLVLRDGRVAARINQPPFSMDFLVEAMTGHKWQGRPDELKVIPKLRETVDVAGFSLAIHRGQVLGLAGLLGSGTNSILHRLFGSDPPWNSSGVRDAIARGRALVPGERSRSLVGSLSVRDNILLPHLHRYVSWTGQDERAMNEKVGRMIELLDIRPRAPWMPVRKLSGGNQQKVAFAKWLASDAEVLLLDEPTNGIDIAAKGRIHQAIQEFTLAGGSVLMSSSDLNELLDLSHTIAVLRQGKVTEMMRRGDDFGEPRLRRLLGVG
jgi:ABC-type sugar transport system ATPase subunit